MSTSRSDKKTGALIRMTVCNKKDIAQMSKGIGLLCLVLPLAACNVERQTATNDAPLSAIQFETLPMPQSAQRSAGKTADMAVQPDIETELANRKSEYDAVIQQAKMRGMLGGALQGGLLVMLMTGSPEGALFGGVAGGAIGQSVAAKTATNIVDEHRNFLIRKWSIETVVEAARMDTENTRFDLLLSRRALEATRSKSGGLAAIGDRGVAFLSDFRERAESRALVLHEVMPIFAKDAAVSEQLSLQLEEQVALLRDMRNNIDKIIKIHE